MVWLQYEQQQESIIEGNSVFQRDLLCLDGKPEFLCLLSGLQLISPLSNFLNPSRICFQNL